MNEFMTMKTTMQIPPLLALCALALAATGCSTFNGEWKHVALNPPNCGKTSDIQHRTSNAEVSEERIDYSGSGLPLVSGANQMRIMPNK